ncbi:metallophosphoesterase [Flammeovirga sp. OC4]|uniref:metallophosphoesterase n=1 Tax=Flammeovirga sp. OC4 TaxID=1382345 RepID=UPI0005C5F076|nr:metallophosphoesterase [Flammeovirga sp. OC4]
MKIQICSDLHLEFEENRKWIKENPLEVKGEILIIAGDTYYLDQDFAELDFIQKVSTLFERVFLIPGNHEYYNGFDLSITLDHYCMDILPNVHLVNNYSIVIDGYRLIFSTLWSKISPHNTIIERRMNDFHRIKYNGELIDIEKYNDVHKKCFDFLQSEINKPENKIVITHHLPSKECNHPDFYGSILNQAFCVDKTDFILENTIQYWIYGHSHRNMMDFQIGNTQMLTNQLGYVQLGEHQSFDLGKVIHL